MKRKIKKIGIAVCTFCVLGLGVIAATDTHKANAESELIFSSAFTVEESYDYGESFSMPDPSQVQIGMGSLITNAVSAVLEFPDGTAKSQGDYTLDKTGTYTLTYYNAAGVSATQSFVVNKRYYGVSGEVSANYLSNLTSKESTDGISVTLKSGESFSFNKPINLKDYENQALEICQIFPKFRKEYDVNPNATTLSVKVVDCYDPEKFVEFYVWCGPAGNSPYYAGAGASTQTLTGFEQNKGRPDQMTEEYEGEMYKIHRPRRYQSLTAYGKWLASRYDADVVEHDGISLLWDLSNHQMKARNGGTTYLITDIDSPEVYGMNTFDYGSFFTTGEVYLNLEAYNYASTSFDVEIESIFGMRGTELLDGTVVDTQVPEVFVDVETTEGNTIYLQKGKEVSLPEISSVRDLNYYGNANLSVYRNYGKAGEVSVKVRDGKFTPTSVGNYTAVYTATDSYGLSGKYLLDMVVLDEENIVYDVSSLEKLTAAKTNVFPYAQASGINKDVAIHAFVIAPNGEEIPLDDNGVDGYEFLPEYAGTYTVKYLFKDNVYEEEYSYTITCTDENVATFKDPFVFPAYFMKNASYAIAPVTAYTAGDGAFKENEATISVSVDGKEYQTLSASQMQSYKVQADNTLQFKAVYGSNVVESPLYSVVDVGYGKAIAEKDYLQYMQGNYVASEISKNGAAYEYADGNAHLQFINTISSLHFKLEFAFAATEAKELSVVLRDVRSPKNNYVLCSYEKAAGGNLALSVKQYENGKVVSESSVYTKRSVWSGEYLFEYSENVLEVEGTSVSGIIPFATDGALLEIYAAEAKDCVVTVSTVNNQKFAKSMRESKPQMSFAKENGSWEMNALYTVAPCYVNSALCSVLPEDVKVTVTDAKGEIVESLDGVRLENAKANRNYDIRLTQIGQFRVRYTVSCSGSNTNGETVLENEDYYIINVSEGIAPTIRFNDGSNERTVVSLSVGSRHDIKSFTVSDNVSAKENLKVYTMIFDEGFHLEENGLNVESYTFRNVGKFIVCVIAYDEQGNNAFAYYNVEVVYNDTVAK